MAVSCYSQAYFDYAQRSIAFFDTLKLGSRSKIFEDFYFKSFQRELLTFYLITNETVSIMQSNICVCLQCYTDNQLMMRNTCLTVDVITKMNYEMNE
jgi:hypothetical protein